VKLLQLLTDVGQDYDNSKVAKFSLKSVAGKLYRQHEHVVDSLDNSEPVDCDHNVQETLPTANVIASSTSLDFQQHCQMSALHFSSGQLPFVQQPLLMHQVIQFLMLIVSLIATCHITQTDGVGMLNICPALFSHQLLPPLWLIHTFVFQRCRSFHHLREDKDLMTGMSVIQWHHRILHCHIVLIVRHQRLIAVQLLHMLFL